MPLPVFACCTCALLTVLLRQLGTFALLGVLRDGWRAWRQRRALVRRGHGRKYEEGVAMLVQEQLLLPDEAHEVLTRAGGDALVALAAFVGDGRAAAGTAAFSTVEESKGVKFKGV